MALGRRKNDQQVQQQMFVTTTSLPRSPGHPFYVALNRLLAEAQFDEFVEKLCAPLYSEGGRPSIPPGVYFRMLLVGYFENIDSQRGIAWRCCDSMSLRTFLGLQVTQASPDHSSLTVIRRRISKELIDEVFAFVLKIAVAKHVLKAGGTVGVDATTLEANAAMKSIVRRDSGEGWRDYVARLAKAEGIENPTEAELRNFDRKRKGRKTSNEEWKSPADPDARVAKMKDGRTHMAYKAEHATDLASEIVVAANVQPADRADSESIKTTITEAQANLMVTADAAVSVVVADKGYHKAETLAWCEEQQIATCVAERKSKNPRRWTDKPEAWKHAVYSNRRRLCRARGKALQRRRSEVVERGFAHVCRTGGARRTWIRGLDEVAKRYLVAVMGYNLAVVMRKLFGAGKPKEWSARSGKIAAILVVWMLLRIRQLVSWWIRRMATCARLRRSGRPGSLRVLGLTPSSTGC